MSKYYSKNQKTRREKIGFYTAFAICLIAVCMAVYSTYTTVRSPESAKTVSVSATGAVAVNEPVTHVTVPVPTLGTRPITPDTTAAATEPPTEAAPAPSEEPTQGRADALQTMLAADVSMGYPTKSGLVLMPYSTDSVYFKTLNSWKPHTGTDFRGELGEDVLAMLTGEVTKVTDDKLLGKTVEITSTNVVIGYCGLGSVKDKPGDRAERGDAIAAIGAVPCEAGEPNHIHVYVKVNGAYADPLTFINNDN